MIFCFLLNEVPEYRKILSLRAYFVLNKSQPSTCTLQAEKAKNTSYEPSQLCCAILSAGKVCHDTDSLLHKRKDEKVQVLYRYTIHKCWR